MNATQAEEEQQVKDDIFNLQVCMSFPRKEMADALASLGAAHGVRWGAQEEEARLQAEDEARAKMRKKQLKEEVRVSLSEWLAEVINYSREVGVTSERRD